MARIAACRKQKIVNYTENVDLVASLQKAAAERKDRERELALFGD